MTLLVFYLIAALDFSFPCSIAEAVLLSITPVHLAPLEENHRSQWTRRAQRLELTWADPDGSAEASSSARVQDG